MRRTSSSTGDNKISVPRHRKQASPSADRQEMARETRERQEMAIETRERQEAQIEMVAELKAIEDQIEFNEGARIEMIAELKAIEDQIELNEEMIAELKAIEDQIMDEEAEKQNDFMLSEKQRKGE